MRREKSASRARSQSREVAGGERRRSVARAGEQVRAACHPLARLVQQAREVVGQERGRPASRLPDRLAVEQVTAGGGSWHHFSCCSC